MTNTMNYGMQNMNNMMSEMQKDLLKEYVNGLINHAASLLSEMANQHILVSVPDIELVNMSDEKTTEGKFLSNRGLIVSSSMKFGQEFSGRALLVFTEQKAKQLVDACIGIIPLEDSPVKLELKSSDFDCLKEMSNIILNSMIGAFSSLIDAAVEFSVPDVELIYVSKEDQILSFKKNVYIMMLNITFTIEQTEVEGFIVIALGMNSLNKLLGKIDEVLGEIS